MEGERGFDGYTGKALEDEILPRISDQWEGKGYFDEKTSFDWVRAHQPWNPADPYILEGGISRIANDLHFKVAEMLGLEDVNELKLYTALDSPLDRFYGIDAFFQYGTAIFTIDLTANPHKTEYKADLVLNPDDLMDKESLTRIAKQIAEFIKKRREERGRLAA